jgi:hypothetical protein
VTSLVAELLRKGSAVRLVARGGSMWPWIRDGATVVISPRLPDKGDIAAAIHEGSLILHRVMRISANELHLRGDALDRVELVGRASVIGSIPSRVACLVPLTRLLARARRRFFRQPR